jgi:hypothetical protein
MCLGAVDPELGPVAKSSQKRNDQDRQKLSKVDLHKIGVKKSVGNIISCHKRPLAAKIDIPPL